MTNGIASETNGITRGTNGDGLLPCWHCGGEVAIALHSNEFGEYWWSVQRGYDDETACKCRLFMESDAKFCLDVEEGEQAKDSPWAMELRARLVEKWNTRAAEAELIELAHSAWSMALCAMQGMPIPAEWGEAVERGLRGHGIDVDDEKAAFEEDEDEW